MIKKYIFVMAVAAVAVVLAIPLCSLADVPAVPTTAAMTTSTVANPLPPLPAACYSFSRSLSIGVSGADVLALQNYLAEEGYFSVTPTGYFGVITQAAVGRWQAQNNVVALGGYGNGTFGPLSRARFSQLCGGGASGTGVGDGNGGTSSTPPQAPASFSVNPQSGMAPLTVQFVATAPQGTTLGNAVNFGDGTQGNLGVVPVCSNCNAEGIVSHTYVATGTYTATLTSGACSCPANGVCNCPNLLVLATTTVVVNSASASSTGVSGIQQLDSPGDVTLSLGGIAEIRNESAYFTLESIASSSATIGITPVGCWNSFPSDPPPQVVCMLAMVPIPPQTLTLGATYAGGKYSITLTQLSSTTATFSVED